METLRIVFIVAWMFSRTRDRKIYPIFCVIFMFFFVVRATFFCVFLDKFGISVVYSADCSFRINVYWPNGECHCCYHKNGQFSKIYCNSNRLTSNSSISFFIVCFFITHIINMIIHGNLKKSRQKNSWNQINQFVFREVAFLVVLSFFLLQNLIFGHFRNGKKWNFIKIFFREIDLP